jgi:enoyl-CoA hydratase/carnithine racemase
MPVLTCEARGAAAWLTINRPEQRNALSAEVVNLLREALATVKADERIRAVVLTGAGDRDFSAGGDLNELGRGGDALADHRDRAGPNRIFRELQELGKPTIARVAGLALAGGFGLALGCDFIIASSDAQFGLPEVRVGLWPYIITEPLVRAVGQRAALQLMLTGRRIGAEEGRCLGFVYQVCDKRDIDGAVDSLVAELKAASPQAIALGRTSFYQATEADSLTRMAVLEYALSVNLGLPDAQEGIAAFREHRAPRWAT